MKTNVPETGVADIVTEKSTKPSVGTDCVPVPVQVPAALSVQLRVEALENVGATPEEAGANRVAIAIAAPPPFPVTQALKFCRVQE